MTPWRFRRFFTKPTQHRPPGHTLSERKGSLLPSWLAPHHNEDVKQGFHKTQPKKNWKTRPQPWLELSLWCPTWRPLPEPCESCQHKTHLNCNGHSLYTLLCLEASDYWIQRKKILSSIVCYSMLHMRGVSILGLCDLMLLSKDSLHGQFLALTDVFMTWTWTRKSPVAALIRAEHSKCEVN